MTKTLTLVLCVMATAGIARAQAPSHFTVHHTIQFQTGTDQDLQPLGADPSAQLFAGGFPFEIAREDLNDDGTKEVILLGCGSESCGIVVLDIRGGTATKILEDQILHPAVDGQTRMAVTNEKIGSYRALAGVDAHGAIPTNPKWGAPKFAYQLVYPMEPPPAAQAASVPSTPVQSACGGLPNCAEVPTFVAMVTDFRVSRGGAYLRDRILTATVRFTNKTERTLVLGYVQNSGVILDDQGNRYRVPWNDAVRGIGTIDGGRPDPKFSLAPGERGDARFEFVFSPGNEVLGTTYEMDLAVREIDAIVGNQWQLGREHALHFRGFTDAGIVPTASAAPSPAAPAPVPAPPTAAGASAAPAIDPCGADPGCYSAGPFMAQATRVITRLGTNSINNFGVRVTVKLTNITDRPVILGCVGGTGAMTDNLGNRYSTDNGPNSVSGIGLVLGRDADPKCTLNPGESRSAVFELRRTWRQDVPSTYTYDVTLATLEVLPSQQVRVTHEYAIGFKDLPVSGPSAAVVAPAAGPCAEKPRCDSSGPLMAEVTHVTRSLGTNSVNNFAVRVTVKLTNITKQAIILGYVTGTGALFDNLGHAYADWAVTGIGTVDGARADPQFKLDPGESRSAVFEWRRTYHQDGMPGTYAYDLTIAQLEILPSTQVRVAGEYAVGFAGLTGGFLDGLKDIFRKHS